MWGWGGGGRHLHALQQPAHSPDVWLAHLDVVSGLQQPRHLLGYSNGSRRHHWQADWYVSHLDVASVKEIDEFGVVRLHPQLSAPRLAIPSAWQLRRGPQDVRRGISEQAAPASRRMRCGWGSASPDNLQRAPDCMSTEVRMVPVRSLRPARRAPMPSRSSSGSGVSQKKIPRSFHWLRVASARSASSQVYWTSTMIWKESIEPASSRA